MTTTEKGRRRHQGLFDFLNQYPAATTHQLATLIWAGDERLARRHLLWFTREGLLRRLPHPLYRNGPYVYTGRNGRSTTHSQKILHHLAAVDFHVAVTRQLGRFGARIVPELPWAPKLIPDQTVVWKETVWAIEHHLTGQFTHAGDYLRFMEDEAFEVSTWWRRGMRLGLLVITTPTMVDHVAGQLKRQDPPGLTRRILTRETANRDPGLGLAMPSLLSGR